MDYYKRLFNETRPPKNEKEYLNFGDINDLPESEWVKNLKYSVNLYTQKNFIQALQYINMAINEKPDNSHLYKVRANIKEENNDANGAIIDYKKALFISGNDEYSVYNQIAINFLNIKNFKNSLMAFDIAIELKLQLDDQGIREDLIPYIIDGVVQRVDFEKMYTNRANVKLSLNDFQGCSDDCQVAIKYNPEYSNSYFIYGLLFLTVEQKENAYKALKIAESKGHKIATSVLAKFF